ncbi:MAG: hypothetical protein K2R98_16830 [Gemmataceae bacterium]|nr:hypothetical protein [Gemmataceae bacterium]
MQCRHCNQAHVTRPRGLCWSCYYKPGVRGLYPSTSKFARRGAGLVSHRHRAPTRATTAAPGSEEKIAVMMERLERGESLFHEDDPRDVISPDPANQRRMVFEALESPTWPIRPHDGKAVRVAVRF